MNPTRPALLTTLAGAAWLMASGVASAQSYDGTAIAPAPLVSVDESGASAAIVSDDAVGSQIMPVPPVDPDRWRFTMEPYLWFAGLKFSTAFSPPPGLTSAIDSRGDVNILESLDFGFMGAGKLRRGKISVQTDILYVALSHSGSHVREINGPLGGQAVADLGSNQEVKAGVWTLAAGYDVYRDERSYAQLFGGFRYLGVKSSLDWTFQGPIADLPRTGSVSDRADIWDGIIGARGALGLGQSRWMVNYYGDVGAGASKLTWQASAQLAYAERWGDFGFGWRYLDYEQDNDKFIEGVRLSGPIVSLHYRF